METENETALRAALTSLIATLCRETDFDLEYFGMGMAAAGLSCSANGDTARGLRIEALREELMRMGSAARS